MENHVTLQNITFFSINVQSICGHALKLTTLIMIAYRCCAMNRKLYMFRNFENQNVRTTFERIRKQNYFFPIIKVIH